MSSRIRYQEKKPNYYVSKKTFRSSKTGAEYRVHLDTDEMLFKIQNMRDLRFVISGGKNINNLNVLKRTAKKRLELLGVEFNSEYRNRTFGRCSKGYNQEKHEEQNV